MAFLTDTRTIIAMVLHVGVAGWVSVHALLNKRDVGSTAGWIGLAWLSPLFGGALYFIFGINRVQRRAQELHEATPSPSISARLAGDLAPAEGAESLPGSERDDHLAALDRAAGLITGRPVLAGNKVTKLRNGDEAYPQMLAAIEAVVGRPVPVTEADRRPGDPAELVASSARAHAVLGWTPVRSGLHEIITDAWQAFAG